MHGPASAPLPDDFGHLLAAAVLLLSLALLWQRRPPAMLSLHVAQAGVVAFDAAWQGAMRLSIGLVTVALVTALVLVVAVPAALRRSGTAFDPAHRTEPLRRAVAIPPLGLMLASLATFAVLRMTPQADLPMREDFSLALATVLLGVLLAATRRSDAAQVIGILCMGNGVLLAAMGAPDLPLLAVAIVAFVSVATLAMLALRSHGRVADMFPERFVRLPWRRAR